MSFAISASQKSSVDIPKNLSAGVLWDQGCGGGGDLSCRLGSNPLSRTRGDRLTSAAMLPILIVPDRLFEPAELPRIDASRTVLHHFATPKSFVRTPKAPTRVRCRLARVIEIRHKLPSIMHSNCSAPGSLQDCDQLLKVLMRRKIQSLGCRERAQIRRTLHATNPITVSAWAMSWRGVSTARQMASPPLHAPTLIVQWWASMPGSLCFGPAGHLLQVLGDCAARLYRFWRGVVERMRASGSYVLDPRLVRIKFTPVTGTSAAA
jgi:hypothetical protein